MAVLDINLFTLILSMHSFSNDAFFSSIESCYSKHWEKKKKKKKFLEFTCPKPRSTAILSYIGLQDSWLKHFAITSEDIVFREFREIRFWKYITTAFLFNFIGQRICFFMSISKRSKARPSSFKTLLLMLLPSSWAVQEIVDSWLCGQLKIGQGTHKDWHCCTAWHHWQGKGCSAVKVLHCWITVLRSNYLVFLRTQWSQYGTDYQNSQSCFSIPKSWRCRRKQWVLLVVWIFLILFFSKIL